MFEGRIWIRNDLESRIRIHNTDRRNFDLCPYEVTTCTVPTYCTYLMH